MGLTGSKSEEMVYYTDATPIKYEVPKRRLNVDPRSPSDDITRTPIVVEKTPETLLDPRSPTPGIMRTPITAGSNPVQPLVLRQQYVTAEKEITKQQLYYSDAVNDNCTLIDIHTSETEELKEVLDSFPQDSSSDVSHEHDSSSDVSPEDSEDRQANQNLLESRESSVSPSPSTELSDLADMSPQGNLSVMLDFQILSVSDDEVATLLSASKSDNDKKAGLTKKTKGVSKIPRPCQPKKLFTEKRKCEMSKTVVSEKKYELTRSPLSTVIVDSNSPRKIMQRKQSKKIDRARQCHIDGSRPNDKENFNH